MASKPETVPFLGDDNDSSQIADHRDRRMPNPSKDLISKLTGSVRGYSHIFTILFTSLIWGMIIFPVKHFHRSSHVPVGRYHELQLSDLKDYGSFAVNARLLSCGFSTSEAKELGCQYDILVGKWLPSFCIDRDAITEYQADGSWHGYADWNRTELLTEQQMSETDVYYTSARDHIVHCANLWMKQYRAFFEGRDVFDSIIASKEHTHHCAKFLVDMSDHGTEWRTVPIPVFVGQAGCFVKS